jgi:Toprim domain
MASDEPGAVHSTAPAMCLPVRDCNGKFQGMQATWLNPDMTAKAEQDPVRKTYGLLKGNFVCLCSLGVYEGPIPKLIIGEGSETVLSPMQLTELPGIASSGKGFFKDINPPAATEYILLVDNDESGGSRKDAGILAQRLVGSVVRIAMPEKPEGGKDGYDWNDALVDAGIDETKLAELKRQLLEAPRFETVMTEEEKREVRLNALAALRLDDPLAYEAGRNQAADDLHFRVSVLDEETARRIKLKLEEARSEPPPVNIELLAASARDIIESEDVLELLVDDLSRVIAGEENYIKLIYLVGTSRLFGKCMHAALKGTSSVGKSELRKRVLKTLPPEAVIEFTSLTEKALLYFKDDFEHKVLSMGEAQGSEEFRLQDYLLRELMSEGKLRHFASMKVGSKIETVTIEKNGPVAFIVTTTQNSLNPENETRMLSLECDDSEEQTRRVLAKVAEVEGYGEELDEGDFQRWHNYQRWLAAGECRVVVLFSRTLSELLKSVRSVRLRRDFGQLLRAIRAHALLHRAHRQTDEEGRIKATIREDYAAVRKLMAELMNTQAELKTRKQINETVAAVKAVEERRSEDDPYSARVREQAGAGGVTVREVADHLRADRSGVFRRLLAAVHLGYLTNLETRKGYPGRYRTTAGEVEAIELLPTVRELQRALRDKATKSTKSTKSRSGK